MFEKVIKIHNEKNPKRKISKSQLINGWVLEGFCSYQYGYKLIVAVDSGKQLRINWKILKYTAGFCEVTMDELYKQF